MAGCASFASWGIASLRLLGGRFVGGFSFFGSHAFQQPPGHLIDRFNHAAPLALPELRILPDCRVIWEAPELPELDEAESSEPKSADADLRF